MSVDLYLPSLPEIGRVFGASVPQVQLTLSGYLFCFAVGQIVYGPISDHVARKPVLLAALSLYLAVCLGCAFAASIEMLVALRCLQALGVAAAPVVARAIVRDLYQGCGPAVSSPAWVRSRRWRRCSRLRSAACCRQASAGGRASSPWPRSALARSCWWHGSCRKR